MSPADLNPTVSFLSLFSLEPSVSLTTKKSNSQSKTLLSCHGRKFGKHTYFTSFEAFKSLHPFVTFISLAS